MEATYLYIDANILYVLIAACALLFMLVLYLAFRPSKGLDPDEAEAILIDAEFDEPPLCGDGVTVPHSVQLKEQRDYWKSMFVMFVSAQTQRNTPTGGAR